MSTFLYLTYANYLDSIFWAALTPIFSWILRRLVPSFIERFFRRFSLIPTKSSPKNTSIPAVILIPQINQRPMSCLMLRGLSLFFLGSGIRGSAFMWTSTIFLYIPHAWSQWTVEWRISLKLVSRQEKKQFCFFWKFYLPTGDFLEQQHGLMPALSELPLTSGGDSSAWMQSSMTCKA